jgi:hypothetical protein
LKGNKQRQRERSTKKENDSDNSYLESSKDVLYAENNKEPKKRGVKIDETISKPQRTKKSSGDKFNMVSIESHNNNTIDYDDRMKPIKSVESQLPPIKPHVPIRVHVPNKPSENEINRIYNPYTAKDEYETYMKNGFLFEPLGANSNMSTFSVQSTSILSRTPVHQSNISIRSETIAPARPKRSEKKTIKGAHTNKTFEPDTEFKNLNQLKSNDTASFSNFESLGRIGHQQQGPPKGSTANIKATIVNAESKSHESDNDRINSTKKDNNSYENKFYYDDEHDLVNKYERSNNKANLDLMNSIHNEIKRNKIKIGLDGDSSKA